MNGLGQGRVELLWVGWKDGLGQGRVELLWVGWKDGFGQGRVELLRVVWKDGLGKGRVELLRWMDLVRGVYICEYFVARTYSLCHTCLTYSNRRATPKVHGASYPIFKFPNLVKLFYII